MRYLLAILLCLAPGFARGQSVQVPYSGSAPYAGAAAYSGSSTVTTQVTGLPTGCVVGTPTYSSGVITVPITGCGVTPPPTTCAKTVSPTGGVDNSNWLSAITAAGGKCVEVLAGTYNLTPFTPPTGANLLIDDGVFIKDSGIFSQFQVFFPITNSNVTIAGKGPLFNSYIEMPTNYANAQAQVAKGNDYEYQHAISLQNGVSGVVLSGFNILNAAGDGLNFNNTKGATITNVNSGAPIRQNYSLTGPTTGVTIVGGLLHDGPHTGFDIEPNAMAGAVQLTSTGLTTQNNKGGSISTGLMNLTTANSVNIVFNKPTSNNDSGVSFAYWNASNPNSPSGSVTYTNAVSNNAGADCSYGQRSSVGYVVTFDGLTCNNPNSQTTSGPNQTNTALGLQCNSCTGGAVPGGVQWLNVVLTGGNGAYSIPSNATGVRVSGTYNGKAISYP